MSEKTVLMKDIDDVRPDPDQPRKVFNEDDVASTAFTIESQGIINPIEIDENNMIVTGEIRWRAAKKAGLKQIPCVVWEDGTHKRFERQVVENLHHHQLSDQDREAAIVKLWKTGQYPTRAQLAKAVGLDPSRITQLLEVDAFREEAPELEDLKSISSSDITETRSIEEKDKRIKVLKGVSDGIIKSRELGEVVKLSKTSDALLDKVLENKIPLQRATQAAETIQNIEKDGVALTEGQKQNLADKVAEDEDLLDKYKSAVLEKVRQVATRPKTGPRVVEPIGRESFVNKIIAVKDEVLDNFKIYLGNCDMKEQIWAKKIMIDTRDELSILIEMIKED